MTWRGRRTEPCIPCGSPAIAVDVLLNKRLKHRPPLGNFRAVALYVVRPITGGVIFLVWRWGTIPTLQSPACECRLRHLCSRQIQSSHTITADSLAPRIGFEPTTFRLGGLCDPPNRVCYFRLFNYRRFFLDFQCRIAPIYRTLPAFTAR